ncbi:hypothetical protein FAES_3262 [Fibrella aestuarina BUZ 2]|uniref:Uncharacterized protein n=1 Tax=Fibrella aestuarina BUZ 2 TaxID=1166018 RepID=I0KAW8_9BACT|nr:hypothetical protein FAES_3262 [Fibrella aestuarina BUZ 2]
MGSVYCVNDTPRRAPFHSNGFVKKVDLFDTLGLPPTAPLSAPRFFPTPPLTLPPLLWLLHTC